MLSHSRCDFANKEMLCSGPTCAVMMHRPMSKIFEVRAETEQLFPLFLKRWHMTDARICSMNMDVSEPMRGTWRENNDRSARGCVMAKHARGFQQVLMTQQSQDTLNLLVLASECETTQELLWLHGRNVFCPNTVDEYNQAIHMSTEWKDEITCPVYPE